MMQKRFLKNSIIILKLFSPKKINNIYGWRSNFAQKNQETWDEAQRYGAKQLI